MSSGQPLVYEGDAIRSLLRSLNKKGWDQASARFSLVCRSFNGTVVKQRYDRCRLLFLDFHDGGTRIVVKFQTDSDKIQSLRHAVWIQPTKDGSPRMTEMPVLEQLQILDQMSS